MHLPEPFGPIDPGWEQALAPVSADLERILGELDAGSSSGELYFPAAAQVLRAFQFPFEDVRVIVVGQDPYPTPGHAMGLAFSAAGATSPVPASLRNIFKELVADVGAPLPASCDLTPWAEQGVLLLNRVLTVGAGGGSSAGPSGAGSHRGRGWEAVTQRAVAALVKRGGPLVAVLWGKDAQGLRGALEEVPIVESVHPSPLSAYRGFFGSRPFSQVNELLRAQGAKPIEWALPGEPAGGAAGAVASGARGPDELRLWD